MNHYTKRFPDYNTGHNQNRNKRIVKGNSNKSKGKHSYYEYEPKKIENNEISTGPSTPRVDQRKQLNGFSITVLGDSIANNKDYSQTEYVQYKFALAKNLALPREEELPHPEIDY